MEKISKDLADKIKEWVFNKDYSDSELSYRVEISEFNTFIDSLTEKEEKKKIEPLDKWKYKRYNESETDRDLFDKINEIAEWIKNHD